MFSFSNCEKIEMMKNEKEKKKMIRMKKTRKKTNKR